jgi:hypothetical protein
MPVYERPASSAQAWFARGDRVGYDPKAHAIVSTGDAPVRIFLWREGELSRAISFLPGYPDGSFGWAKVRPHFTERGRDAETLRRVCRYGRQRQAQGLRLLHGRARRSRRSDLAAPLRRVHDAAFDFSSLFVLELLRRRLERSERGEPPGGPRIRGVFIFNGGSLPTGTPTPGTPRLSCAAFPTGRARAWGAPSRCSR